jgi:hypothetical protein
LDVSGTGKFGYVHYRWWFKDYAVELRSCWWYPLLAILMSNGDLDVCERDLEPLCPSLLEEPKIDAGG